MKKSIGSIILLFVFLTVLIMNGCAPTPTPEPTPLPPTYTLEPTKTPTATFTFTPTETEIPTSTFTPTATPIIGLIDQFDGNQLDRNIWECGHDCTFEYLALNDGNLELSRDVPGYTQINTIERWNYSDIYALRTKIMLSLDSTYSTSWIEVSPENANCLITNLEDVDRPYIQCNANDEYHSKKVPMEFDKWYEVEIRFPDDSGYIEFYIENELIGAYQYTGHSASVEMSMGLYSSDQIYSNSQTYFDYVEVILRNDVNNTGDLTNAQTNTPDVEEDYGKFKPLPMIGLEADETTINQMIANLLDNDSLDPCPAIHKVEAVSGGVNPTYLVYISAEPEDFFLVVIHTINSDNDPYGSALFGTIMEGESGDVIVTAEYPVSEGQLPPDEFEIQVIVPGCDIFTETVSYQ